MSYEKLGAFYLGKTVEPGSGEMTDDILLYDAKDLTTHAVCVGMTGSGKTGLCISLLEEAAIDGIPSIIIDPKGDLPNLLLTFPELRGSDFLPWIDESRARDKELTPEQYAEQTATLWKKGLADWDQDGSRIARFRDAAEAVILTPGSTAGLPINVMRSFEPPPADTAPSSDAFRDRVTSTTSGLLSLLGIDEDPAQSKEHVLIANIFENAWSNRRSLSLESLLREIQSPPFEKIGALDIESYYPSGDRVKLAHKLNTLLASPSFATWLEGIPLDIDDFLYTEKGKPRLAIFSIAHLSESERMFFVTLLLNEVVSWMRKQQGSSALRALLYMDEVFGYLPPTAKPPSKTPMLTLLKQARAYGLGVVLATQNPVDLDYKALSNAGTWLLGRLQTERDKERVLDGLEGASGLRGAGLDRKHADVMLSGLKSRVFLMNNVHEKTPALFHTRWALSYLAGPMTRPQIEQLMKEKKEALPAKPAPEATPVRRPRSSSDRPMLPPEIEERFVPWTGSVDQAPVYSPHLYGHARLHFARVSAKLDRWEETAVVTPIKAGQLRGLWDQSREVNQDDWEMESQPVPSGKFQKLPTAATREKTYTSWRKALIQHLYRSRQLTVWRCKLPKAISRPGESERDFRVRLGQLLREDREEKIERLRERYTTKLDRIQGRIQRAERRVQREASQYEQQKTQSMISVGASVLGALLGRKLVSSGNVGRATTAARGFGRASREKGDIARAQQALEEQQEKLRALERKFEDEVERLEDSLDASTLPLEEIVVRPRKTDISIEQLSLVWVPQSSVLSSMTEPALV